MIGNATINDNSCAYEATMSFWYAEDCADWFSFGEVSSLKFYLDGVLIGSKSADTYFTSNPGCGVPETVPTTQDLGGLKEKEFNLVVLDEDGDIAWDVNITLDANTCTSVRLTYGTMYPYMYY